MRKNKICFVAAIELTICAFMVDHLKKLSRENRITVVVNTNNVDFLKPYDLDISVVPVKIERRPSPISDMVALCRLYRFFKREGFDSVHSITPKAGLLAMIASRLACVPVRIHTFTGQVWVARKGVKRWLLKSLDRLLAASATHILVDSPSQRDFIVSEGVVSGIKAKVIGDGSICGVDADRFTPDEKARKEIRKNLSIAESDIVFLYVGRLNRDKGLLILAQSFSKVSSDFPNAHLIMAGPDEEGMHEDMLSFCINCSKRIHFIGYTEMPEQYMAAADIFCLPSYREGFGIVVIEAASAGIPSIASRIYGVTDTIEDGITGLLFTPGNADELAGKMRSYLNSPSSIKEMGMAARKRTLSLYSKDRVTEATLEFYRKILGMK